MSPHLLLVVILSHILHKFLEPKFSRVFDIYEFQMFFLVCAAA